MLFIHINARGKGIGKLLVEFVINNLKINKVHVNEHNEQAIGSYKHLGFKIISRSPKDAFSKPYPLLHMQL